jgi:macrolide transport system ATP-binding/permease protein
MNRPYDGHDVTEAIAAASVAGLQQPIIELVDVTKTYVSGERSVQVLHGISLSIARGDFIAIMGQSGSGKSTLMNILGCLDRATDGQYVYDGRDVADLDSDALAELRRDSFGFIFQSYNLIATGTALENVEVPAVYAGISARRRHDRAQELLGVLGLGDRTHHRPNQLSGGQQQRVSIARALMNGGEVIFADEPTGALDSRSGTEVMALLQSLNAAGHTIILITHDREVATQAKRIIELKDGLVVSDSRVERSVEPARADTHLTPLDPDDRGGRASVLPVRLAESGEALKMALRSLKANLFRTVLTLLGIVIGVGSVVAMLAVGDGAKQSVLDRIGAMGTNLLLVRPGAANVRGTGAITSLMPADAEAIAEIPNVRVAVPELGSGVTLRYGNADYQTSATGTSPDLPVARDWKMAYGTFLTDSDIDSYAPVAVLGQTVVGALFPPTEDPVGRYVLVNNVPFLVVGVLDRKGASPYGSDQDDVIFVPYTTGSMRLFGIRHLRTITVLIDDLTLADATQDAITSLLTQRHGKVDFQIRNMASILEAAAATQGTLTILLGSIAAISLLVGGIGVMNIMLVSVTERTREIGIRIATGARMANILQQFITEAMVVSAIGGFIGVAGGLGTAWGLSKLGTPIVFSLTPVLLAFSCAFATGLIFGYMPARKAANLDPVVALGAE